MALIYTEFEVDNVSFHIFTLPDRRPTAGSSRPVKWLYQMDVESFLYNHGDDSRTTGAFYRLLQRTPGAAGRALCLRKASVGQGLITDADWEALREPFQSSLRVLTLVPVDVAAKAIAVFGETDRSAALIKALGYDRPSEWEQGEDEVGEEEGEEGEGRANEGGDDDDEGGSNSGEHSGDRSDGGASVAATEQFEYNEETHSLWFVHRGWQMLLAQCLFPHSPLRFELSKKNVSSCLDEDSFCRRPGGVRCFPLYNSNFDSPPPRAAIDVRVDLPRVLADHQLHPARRLGCRLRAADGEVLRHPGRSQLPRSRRLFRRHGRGVGGRPPQGTLTLLLPSL